MIPLIYGSQKTIIGDDEILTKCPACEIDTFQEVIVTSNYYHFYYVPIFPIEKEISFICSKCGLRRYDIPLSKRTVPQFDEVNRKFKHPWYTYFFTLLVSLVILIAILTSKTQES
jgi:hypothetical protein